MRNNKKLIVYIIIGIVILVIISVSIFAVVKSIKKEDEQPKEEPLDTESLEIAFKQPFSSEPSEYVRTQYNIEDFLVGKYKVQACVPNINVPQKEAVNINKEIQQLIVNSILKEAFYVQQYTTYHIEYETYMHGNILSLIIRCTIKGGENPRRIIVKTYNYDIENGEQVDLLEIINEEQKNDIQEKIMKKIEEENKKAEEIIKQGYNGYTRDKENEIYKVENANEFFIGNDNILYIVYAYGNQDYTDEMDLIMERL